MSQAGFKWICIKCGYRKYSGKPPEECPECGAGEEDFGKSLDDED
jgi:rubrerythrin